MAVLIDVPTFRSSIPAKVAAVAERLLKDGGVGDLESVGGGVRAVVSDGGIRFQPWVGVVERAFSGDCDCGTRPVGDDFCAHSVAVALTALDAGVRFSAAGRPHGTGPVEPERADYLRAVQRLGPRQLADLVVEQAIRNRLFATLLLGKAGMLDAADESALAGLKAVVRDASNVTNGTRWEIADVENAGHRIVAEAEILRARPPVPAMLDLIEEAIEVWDELAGHLIDAYYARRTDPEEIAEPLTDAHRDLCERLDLEPDEIADRLARLLDHCHNGTVDPVTYGGPPRRARVPAGRAATLVADFISIQPSTGPHLRTPRTGAAEGRPGWRWSHLPARRVRCPRACPAIGCRDRRAVATRRVWLGSVCGSASSGRAEGNG